MLRHADVDAQSDILVCFACKRYLAYTATKYELNDRLDLRPHRHGNHDFSILRHPGQDPYDTATVILGTIYHDILRRRDDIHTHATWTDYSLTITE